MRSKEKGARFERKVCRLLSLWWSDGKSDRVFWRAPTFKQPDGTVHQCGDIVQIDLSYPKCPYCFELKHHKDFRLEDFLTGKKSGIVSWWEQTIQECPPGMKPVLIVHRDRGPTLVLSKHIKSDVWIKEVYVDTLESFLDKAKKPKK